LAGDARIAAFLTFGRLFQNDDLGSELVRSDRCSYASRPETDHDDIGFVVPGVRHRGSVLRAVVPPAEQVRDQSACF